MQSIVTSIQQLTQDKSGSAEPTPPCLPPPGLPSPKPAARKSALETSKKTAWPPVRSRMPDFPAADPGKFQKNVLSETEEEAAEPGLQGGDSLTMAVTKLTEIASHLPLEKKKSRTLESILEGAGSVGHSEVSGATGTRRQAAALRALRAALLKQPEAISKAIERNMAEDFSKSSQMPGTTMVTGPRIPDSGPVPLVRRRSL